MTVRTLILVYVFSIQYVTAHNIISDMTDEHCINKELCEVAGIIGHVDCISDTCVCINGARVIDFQNIRGCYKKNKLGEECEFDQDCGTVKDSKCTQSECKKTCECLPNRQEINGTCEVIKNKAFGTYCETYVECSGSLECSDKTCNCGANQFYIDNKCFPLSDYNMCRNHDECNGSQFCEKKSKDLIYGFCQLSGEMLNFSPCSTKKDCQMYRGYTDCQKGKCTCVGNSTFINNGCYKQNDFGEKCQFHEDCKDKTECKLDNHTNIKRCMCPEKHVYFESACINIECLNRHTCMADKDCKNNEKCELDETCKQTFCQCKHVKINNTCMDLKDLQKPQCEKNMDCMMKNSICVDNVCKCPNGTILLDNTCIALKGQRYGDFCHKKCALPGTKCISPDNSSTIGVCGCKDNYACDTQVCRRNATTIISVDIYCFLFIHFIVIFFNFHYDLVP